MANDSSSRWQSGMFSSPCTPLNALIKVSKVEPENIALLQTLVFWNEAMLAILFVNVTGHGKQNNIPDKSHFGDKSLLDYMYTFQDSHGSTPRALYTFYMKRDWGYLLSCVDLNFYLFVIPNFKIFSHAHERNFFLNVTHEQIIILN